LITVPLRPACRTLFPYTTLFRSEGWDFGEVSGNARFTQATQGQLGGTSIGTFNDRLRDAVHGGSPFDTDKRTNQGFGNGLSTMPNGVVEAGGQEQLRDQRKRKDVIRQDMD